MSIPRFLVLVAFLRSPYGSQIKRLSAFAADIKIKRGCFNLVKQYLTAASRRPRSYLEVTEKVLRRISS